MWAKQIRTRTQRLSRPTHSWRFFGGGGKKVADSLGIDTENFFGQKPDRTVDPFADIRPLQEQLNDLLSGQLGQGVERFGGQRVPGASGLQTAGFDVARGLTPIASGGQQFGARQTAGLDPGTAGRVTGQAEQALSSILGPQDLEAVNELFQTGFVDPAQANIDRLLRGVSERFAGSGSAGATSGGAFGRSLGRAAGEAGTQLNAQLAKILFETDQTNKNRRLQGVGAATNLAQLPGQLAGQGERLGLGPLASLLDIGGVQRGIQGEQGEAGFQEFLRTRDFNNPFLNLLPTAFGVPGKTIVEGGPGLGVQLLAAAAQGAGKAAAGGAG